RADEHQLGGAVWDLVDRAVRRAVEDRPAIAVGEEHRPRVAVREDVVRRDEAELAGMARRARDDDAAWLEERAEAIDCRGRHAASTSTSASTAIGSPSLTMSGFTSIERIVGFCSTMRL